MDYLIALSLVEDPYCFEHTLTRFSFLGYVTGIIFLSVVYLIQKGQCAHNFFQTKRWVHWVS